MNCIRCGELLTNGNIRHHHTGECLPATMTDEAFLKLVNPRDGTDDDDDSD